MNFDEQNISNKSQIVTLFLCLLFGRIGAHRFYVGKYLSGLIFLLIGGTSIVLDLFGFGYSFIVQILYFIILILDIYALYSDNFTDSDGKLVVGKSNLITYDTFEEREKLLFIEKLDKIICICIFFVIYVVYYIVKTYYF